jgi:hypothetical protein
MPRPSFGEREEKREKSQLGEEEIRRETREKRIEQNNKQQ